MPDIKAKLKNLPKKPGVYLFKDKDGGVIYVGKAVNLRSRVAQYFQREGGDGRPQIPFLLKDAADLEYIVTDNEIESLLLENNLIKKYKPHYNIKLRDDKNYVFIKIDFNEQIPQIYLVRNPDAKNAKYFGPYSSALKVRETLNLVRRIFPYCANKKVSDRPCFYYHLHRCPGVCIGKISVEEYKETIRKIILFLAGNISAAKKEIRVQMREAARRKQFERAAQLRDQYRSLEVIDERQKAVFAKKVNWDFVSYFTAVDKTSVNLFAVRSGKLTERKNFILEDTQNKTSAEIISAFIEKYYPQTDDLPKEIYVQDIPSDLALFQAALSQQNKKVAIIKPNKGKKAELIDLGIENAREYFENWAQSQASELSRTTLALEELGKVLSLPAAPFRIECFDISNIQGTNAVASMVVFESGKPKKSDYRKFKMRVDGAPNDFAMMREALSRRFKRYAANQDEWPLPDLLVIDGGKGQLSIATEVLAEMNLRMPAIGLAKREEEIFVPGKSDAIALPKSNYALQLLQRIRDEAHRFAITFHKKIRSREAYKSSLDAVPGVGPKTKKLLIKKFGSVNGVRAASLEDLAALLGRQRALRLEKKLKELL